VLDFVKSWVSPILGEGNVLKPEEWFQEGHGIIGGKKDLSGLWIPCHAENGKVYILPLPHVVADVALEECAKAIHKRTDAYHIFLIPRLYSPLWMRMLYKSQIFVFKICLAHNTGLRPCMNLCSLVFLSHFSPGTLCLYEERRCWWNWSGNCTKCLAPVRKMEGIFCANFCESQGIWPACRKAWHAKCYKCLGQGKFPLKKNQDEEGNQCYKHNRRVKCINHRVHSAHASDNFQCEDCWMVNLEGHLPVKGLDDAYIMLICQANLDPMGGRAVATIQGHAAALKRSIYNCQLFRKMPMIPP
jgi:hypothetical protein